MGQIRSLTATDMPAVAALFMRAFQKSENTPSASFVDYLDELYLHHPSCSEAIPSLVHEAEDGALTGFIGRHSLPMKLAGRQVRGALLSTIMTDKRPGDPLLGAKLAKMALTGPQDFSFTETASDVSLRMWQWAGSQALSGYSLNWIRIIRPAQWLTNSAAQRWRPFRFMTGIAAAGDTMLRKKVPPGEQRWLALGARRAGKAAVTRQIDENEFASQFIELAGRFALRPGWSADETARLVKDASSKPEFGEPVLASVMDQRGRPIGCFFYHLKRGDNARVIQVLAVPGQDGLVIDTLIADAAERGAVAVMGRSQPFLIEAMLGRRIGFTNTASSVLHTRDEEIRQTIACGNALLNGIAGEQWSRLIGGRFD